LQTCRGAAIGTAERAKRTYDEKLVRKDAAGHESANPPWNTRKAEEATKHCPVGVTVGVTVDVLFCSALLRSDQMSPCSRGDIVCKV